MGKPFILRQKQNQRSITNYRIRYLTATGREQIISVSCARYKQAKETVKGMSDCVKVIGLVKELF